MSSTDSQSRKYILTINDPQEHGFDHNLVIDRMHLFHPRYFCLADEVATTGTYHTHAFLLGYSPIRFSTVKRRFPTAHIEAAHGSAKENRDYVRKEGKWGETAKAETSVAGTFFEFGELPTEAEETAPKMHQLVQDVTDGRTTVEIIKGNPSFAFKGKDIDALRETLSSERFKSENRDVKVHYFYGDTGTGKTRGIFERHNPEDVCRVTDYGRKTGLRFDAYHGQDVLVFEEFHSQVPIDAMLNYLDVYPLMLPARYNDRVACYTTVYITSNLPLTQQPMSSGTSPKRGKRFSDVSARSRNTARAISFRRPFMTRNEKLNIRHSLELRELWNRVAAAILANKIETIPKLAAVAIYMAGAVYVWSKSKGIAAAADRIELLSPVAEAVMRHSIRAYLLIVGAALLFLLFYPLGRRWTEDALKSIGLVNRADMAPVLLRKRADKDRSNVTVWTFRNNSIPLKTWADRQAEIETALGVTVVNMKYDRGKQRVVLYTVPAESDLPDFLPWKDRYLSGKSFVLRLGQGYTGPVSVNLADIPHILLGGSTGSGKSVLLKVLIMQALKKGAVVAIADFKGGVDFSSAWRERCRMCFDEKTLLALLDGYIAELEARKQTFSKSGQPNLDAYNRAMGVNLSRYILACDEIAEVLDKTGLAKEQKEIVGQIESRLSIIARQGRAFGIHLIFATQRPDASILSGQIRNNINCRVCGRADNVLSQIILDSTDAAEQIPKDAKGRFLLHDGTVFQGYWLDEGGL